jgi:hypothetical protein
MGSPPCLWPLFKSSQKTVSFGVILRRRHVAFLALRSHHVLADVDEARGAEDGARGGGHQGARAGQEQHYLRNGRSGAILFLKIINSIMF